MRRTLPVIVLAAALAPALLAQNWTESRGPNRNGTSAETNLPSQWSPSGENLAWTLPFGGRSTPAVFGDRLYLQTATTGDVSQTQERLVAVDTNSGQVIWEHRASIYLSDVPQHRAGWASPAVDPKTGNIFMYTVAAELLAFSPDGTVLWKRSMPEEHGAITTHGGRTVSPIVEDGLVILNSLLQGWGNLARPGNRYFAFDTTTGQTVWVSAPQARHYDTNFSSPIVATVDGIKQLIVGGTDGVFHGLKLHTGEPIWSLEVSKRAILNSPLYRDGTVYIAHGEENLDTTEMGMMAAMTPSGGSGALTGAAVKWKSHGFMVTFASPVMDEERLYAIDNGAVLKAFDLTSGDELWTRTLGTLQKGSPTLADGKLLIGTENGKFYILRPSAAGVEILDEDLLGTPDAPEPIIASPAVANGRIYVTSMEHVYAIGPKQATAAPTATQAASSGMASGPVAAVHVYPYEAFLDPGESIDFVARLFNANGEFMREASAGEIQWTTDQLDGGTITREGRFTAPAGGAAGSIKATVAGISGDNRVRVIPSLPWSYDFEGITAAPPWWTSNLKIQPQDVDGSGVIVRPRDGSVGRRTKLLMGKADWSDYTVEVDVRGVEMRRQRGDVGVINQRYILMLFGNNQKLELQPWQAANEMTVSVDQIDWPLDTWFRMKLRVANQADGTTLVQGKVWPSAEPEPDAWTIEKVDRIPHRAGSPGLYGDGISDVFFDNFKVYRNQ